MSREAEQFAKKLLQRGAKNQPMMHEDVLVLRKEDEGENLASGGSGLGGLTAYGAVKNWWAMQFLDDSIIKDCNGFQREKKLLLSYPVGLARYYAWDPSRVLFIVQNL